VQLKITDQIGFQASSNACRPGREEFAQRLRNAEIATLAPYEKSVKLVYNRAMVQTEHQRCRE
jgi:hypothetical protein